MVTHDYRWTRTPASGLSSDSIYTVTWYDGTISLCYKQVKIVGTEEEVEKALLLQALDLRDANPSLFPADEPDHGMIEEA